KWSAVKSPNLNFQNNELTSISALSANDIWAVGNAWDGSIDVQGAPQLTLIEHWNGKKWSIIPSPDPSAYKPYLFNNLYGVTAISTNNVWAVGEVYYTQVPSPLIEHWNGTRWSVVPGAN